MIRTSALKEELILQSLAAHQNIARHVRVALHELFSGFDWPQRSDAEFIALEYRQCIWFTRMVHHSHRYIECRAQDLRLPGTTDICVVG